MSIRQKIQRNGLALNAAVVVLATGVAAYSFAAPDYDRIKKDINVMIGVVKSSFSDDRQCERCRVKITGHYLAEQGVVFNVDASDHRYHDYASDVEVFAEGIAVIPDMVSDILEEVQINIDDGHAGRVWQWRSDEDWHNDNREIRDGLRDLKHEMRELARELRDVEIEAIHAEDDDLDRLREREQEIEQRIADTERREDELRQKLTSYSEQKEREREQRKARRVAEQQERFSHIEDIVLTTFCDYSRTMRNVPSDERVSIIMNRQDDEANIYVFEMKDLESCDSEASNVKEHALTYAF